MFSEAIGAYMEAINDLMQVVGRLRAIDEYYNVLWKNVKLPIRLPKVEAHVKEMLKRMMEDIDKVFHEAAKGMGISYVVVPKRRGAVFTFENVNIDFVKIRFTSYEMKNPYGEVLVIIIRTEDGTIGEVPFAWYGKDEGVYHAHVETVLGTALLVRKNPWLPTVLKRAIEDTFGDYVRMRDEIINFYNALRLIGVEDTK